MFGGTVVHWNEKGYGFIRPDGETRLKDVFVHYTGVLNEAERPLQVGQRVEYQQTDSPRGAKAINVQVIG